MRWIIFTALLLTACAESIVDGEFSRLDTVYPAKPLAASVDVLYEKPDRAHKAIAQVSSRAYLLDRGLDELRRQARLAGADAVIIRNQDRKISLDYAQDLYFIDGSAIVWR